MESGQVNVAWVQSQFIPITFSLLINYLHEKTFDFIYFSCILLRLFASHLLRVKNYFFSATVITIWPKAGKRIFSVYLFFP